MARDVGFDDTALSYAADDDGSLKQAVIQLVERWSGQARVDQDVLIAAPHERRRRVRRAPRLGLVPQAVAAKRADADDVHAYGGHERPSVRSRRRKKKVRE